MMWRLHNRKPYLEHLLPWLDIQRIARRRTIDPPARHGSGLDAACGRQRAMAKFAGDRCADELSRGFHLSASQRLEAPGAWRIHRGAETAGQSHGWVSPKPPGWSAPGHAGG